MTSLLLGRQREVDAIHEALEAARAGHARALVLVGEPGIGKSRLATESVLRAKEQGFLPLWGGCWEAGGAPAYWPLRLLFESLPSGEAIEQDGSLGRLWGRDSMASPLVSDPAQARFELFDAVATVLRQISERTPLLCVLDDLHAGDAPSLELLEFAIRNLRACRITWILTWRKAEAEAASVYPLLARIARDATLLPLVRLSRTSTERLIDELGTETPSAVRESIFRVTEGNPLFVLETMTNWSLTGASEDNIAVARSVSAIVQERADRLTPEAQQALAVAAAIGRDLGLELWLAASQLETGRLQSLAKELVASGLLVPRSSNEWSFSHELVRKAILDTIDVAAVQQTHLLIAQEFDRCVGEGDDTALGRRIEYALLAHERVDAATLVSWAVAASKHARAQCAYEQAITILDRTRSAVGVACNRDTGFLLALARAQMLAGDSTAASEAIRLAMEASEHTPLLFAETVLAAGQRYVLGDLHLDLVANIDRALSMLAPDDQLVRARLLGRKAAALTPAENPEQTLAMAMEAVSLTGPGHDALQRLEVAVSAGSAMADFAHPRQRIPVNQELVALARGAGDRALALLGLSRLVTDHIESGELDAADQRLQERNRLAEELKLSRFAWGRPLFRSMRLMSEGRFADCHEAIAEAEELGRDFPDARRCIAVHRTWLGLLEDDDGGAAREAEVLEHFRSMPVALSIVVRATTAYRAGDVQRASDEVSAMAPTLPHCAVNTLATLAEVVADVGSIELAASMLERLRPHADTNAVWGPFGLTCGPPVSASLGLLAARCGKHDEAHQHFGRAIQSCSATGARAHRAWVRYWYAQALARGSGDEARVRELLDAAATEATELGMSGLARRCDSDDASGKLSAQPQGSPPGLSRWTMREEGGGWRIDQPGRPSILLKNMRGMQMIERLAAQPGQEIHALELVSDGEGVPDIGDAGEMLDKEAIAAYRGRVRELNEIIEDASDRGDAIKADLARSEIDAVESELSRALGLGGRQRRASAPAERARISAQRRIRSAIKRIAAEDAALGEHLATSIRTGTYCVYRPAQSLR